MKTPIGVLAAIALTAITASAQSAISPSTPLSIGETFTIESKTLYLATSSEDRSDITKALAGVLKQSAPPALRWHYTPMPEETHATIYHPAALRALRLLFKPTERR